MNCPKCGYSMEDEGLYCINCGEEVHMVPDFDIEVDIKIANAMETIKKNIGENSSDENFLGSNIENDNKEKKVNINNVFLKFILFFGIIGFSLLVGIYCLYRFFFFSFDFQYSSAIKYMNSKNYENAIVYFERAIKLKSNSEIDIFFSLADCYYQIQEIEKYVDYLTIIIQNNSSTREQIEKAYQKLINFYQMEEDYEIINELILNSSYDYIKNIYQNYVALPPEFSHLEGNYEEIIPLRLNSNTSGNIYYTLDGTEPNENSLLYTAPVFLDEGIYEVNAIFISEHGVKSDMVKKVYNITLNILEAPEVITTSGQYDRPTFIVVYMEEAEEIYYTIDGTIPTVNSTQYTSPIPMPIGDSVFTFARKEENGIIGDVVICEYSLSLNNKISTTEAEVNVINLMIQKQKILNVLGEIPESTGVYLYQYQYPVAIKNEDYFVIAEIFKENEKITRTGSYHAVDIYNGSVYRLQIEDNDTYIIVE